MVFLLTVHSSIPEDPVPIWGAVSRFPGCSPIWRRDRPLHLGGSRGPHVCACCAILLRRTSGIFLPLSSATREFLEGENCMFFVVVSPGLCAGPGSVRFLAGNRAPSNRVLEDSEPGTGTQVQGAVSEINQEWQCPRLGDGRGDRQREGMVPKPGGRGSHEAHRAGPQPVHGDPAWGTRHSTQLPFPPTVPSPHVSH